MIEGDPRVILDSAHNPQGALALARVLPALAGGRNVVACIAVLTDKDAEGIVRALARPCIHLVCTEVPAEAIEGAGARALAPGKPRSSPNSRVRPASNRRRWPIPGGRGAHTRACAERGAVALAAGSHYLLRSLWTERHAKSS